jgi:hypothetical protein
MATLGSPGVAVTVIDESFYTPAAPGTTPLIFVATQENKTNSAGTGVAPGTLKANAGAVYLMTSQMDLGTTFGTPYFQTDASNNPVHAGELNEYGLQAAYSYLGVSSRAYVVRADINTAQLVGTSNIPAGAPVAGTYWFDTTDTAFGIFEWNGNLATTTGGQTFTNRIPVVINDTAKMDSANGYSPLSSIGAIGSYAVTTSAGTGTSATLNKTWYKNYNGAWVLVGSNAWTASWPTVTSTLSSRSLTSTYRLTVSPTYNGTAPSISATPSATTAPRTISTTATAATNNLIAGTNTLVAGDIVSFSLTGNGIVTGQSYYVLAANLSGSNFAISLTAGGTPVTLTTAAYSATATVTTTSGTPCNVITATQTTPLQVGDPIVFGGTVFGSIVSGTTYYIIAVTGNYFAISASNAANAAPFVLTTAAGVLMTAVESETFVTITGVTTFAGFVSALTGKIPGVTCAINSNNQISIYCDGTIDRLVIQGTSGSDLAFQAGLTATDGGAQTYYSPLLSIAPHTSVPQWKRSSLVYNDGYPTGSVWVKSTYPNLGSNWAVWLYNSTTATFAQVSAPLYSNQTSANYGLDTAGGGINIPVGSLFVKYNDSEYTGHGTNPLVADFKVYRRLNAGPTTITTGIIKSTTFTSGTNTFTAIESVVGSAFLGDYTLAGSQGSGKVVTFTASGSATADAIAFAGAVNTAGFTNVTASVNSSNQVVISHATGGTVRFTEGTNTPLAKSGLVTTGTTANLYPTPAGDTTYTFGSMTNWKVLDTNATDGLTYSASAATPTTTTADGQLWYNSVVTDADILVNDGTHWRGLNNYNFTTRASAAQNYGLTAVTPFASTNATDPNGPIVSSTAPTLQSDGTALVQGDLWIDTSDLENYPKISVWNTSSVKWILLDKSDSTSDTGIIFADARWNSTGLNNTQDSIITMMNSDFLDFDAPDPAKYPKGMLLFNLRRSGYNVKKFVRNYINTQGKNPRSWSNEPQTSYYANTWVSQAANQSNGAGTFGRKAQRAVVVQAMAAMISSNQNIRDEDSLTYNLIAAPGYTELIDEMVSLNYDRGIQSFVVADTPARLTPDATSLSNWGNNSAKAAGNGESGLTTTDAYLGVYYPWGYSTDNLGNNITVPPSHMMLRTIALSDNVSYPWFAPAGTRRGGITNASAVGYVSTAGEFQSVALNSGQRDTLAAVHINPITFISGTGLVAYGQYTRQLAASSLDRINVARLVIFLRRQFTVLAKPFVFEPNDTITRNEIRNSAESLLLELVGQRAIYDYLVVCDTTNNTPARIDRSELHLDVAIEPVKAAEFIYIPMRLENTGAIKGLSK